jgi:hypothetical protein
MTLTPESDHAAARASADIRLRSERLADGTRVRLVSRAHLLDGRSLLIRLGHGEEPLWLRIREMLLAALIMLRLVLAVSGFASYG